MKRNNGMKKLTSALLALMCILMCSLPLVSCHDPLTDDFGGVNYSDELKDTDTNKTVPQTEEETTEQLPETTEQPPETTEQPPENAGADEPSDVYFGYGAKVFDEDGLYDFDPVSGEKKLIFETEGLVLSTKHSKGYVNSEGKIFYVLDDEASGFCTIIVADVNTGEKQVYEDVYLDFYGTENWISPTLLYITTRRGGFAVIDIENQTHTHYMNMVFETEMQRGKFVYTNESDRIYYPGDYYAELYYDGEIVFTHEVNRTYIDAIYTYGNDIILEVLFQPYIDDEAESVEKERSFIVRGNIDEDGNFNVIYNCEVDNSLVNYYRVYFAEDGALCFIREYNESEGDTTKRVFESFEYDSEKDAFVITGRSSEEGLNKDYRTGPSLFPYYYPENSTYEPMTQEEKDERSAAHEEISKIIPDYFGEKAFLYSIFKKDAE
ncbi:MAG: hypothetical protein E7665_01250 [Ruminococcaceae bacterium]|nr:hypothetical protein [Oscillospiraceae bacterium]